MWWGNELCLRPPRQPMWRWRRRREAWYILPHVVGHRQGPWAMRKHSHTCTDLLNRQENILVKQTKVATPRKETRTKSSQHPASSPMPRSGELHCARKLHAPPSWCQYSEEGEGNDCYRNSLSPNITAHGCPCSPARSSVLKMKKDHCKLVKQHIPDTRASTSRTTLPLSSSATREDFVLVKIERM